MAAEWFLAREGQQTMGPLTSQQLKQLAAAGQVQGASLVWKQGMPRWVPASQVKGLLGGSGDLTALGPEPTGVREMDWRSAGPPPQVPAVPVPAKPDEEVPQEEEAGEPWYYRFLDRYARVALWLGFVFCLLGYLLTLLLALALAAAAADSFGWARSLLTAAVVAFQGLLFWGGLLLAILFAVALLHLAVDTARNVRALRERDKG